MEEQSSLIDEIKSQKKHEILIEMFFIYSRFCLLEPNVFRKQYAMGQMLLKPFLYNIVMICLAKIGLSFLLLTDLIPHVLGLHITYLCIVCADTHLCQMMALLAVNLKSNNTDRLAPT